jgi:hypothetical protein
MKPGLFDNRNGNTLVAALRGHLDWLGRVHASALSAEACSCKRLQEHGTAQDRF